MTLSKDEWMLAVMEASARMNAVGFMVQALNQLHEGYQGDLEFYIDDDGRLDAAVCGSLVPSL
jgi:hypothetical protein